MRVSLTQRDWLQQCEALTVAPGRQELTGRKPSDDDDVAASRALVADLQHAAAAYVAATACVHTGTAGRCALDVVPGGRQACELARLYTPHAAEPIDDPGAVSRYLDAVRAATPAVYYCRRVAHATRICWFAPPSDGVAPRADVCGRVLAIAHRLG